MSVCMVAFILAHSMFIYIYVSVLVRCSCDLPKILSTFLSYLHACYVFSLLFAFLPNTTTKTNKQTNKSPYTVLNLRLDAIKLFLVIGVLFVLGKTTTLSECILFSCCLVGFPPCFSCLIRELR